MGFVSPAADYIEQRINLNTLLVSYPPATTIIYDGEETYIVDRSVKPKQGSTLAFEVFEESQIGRLMGKSIITPDGEAYEGDALEEVTALGVVPSIIMKLCEDDRSTI